MSFNFNDSINLGNPFDLWAAFAKLGDGGWPQLRHVPYTNEEPMPKEYLKAVREQAADAMKTATDEHLRWVLGRLAGVMEKFNENQPRVPAGSPEGGEFAGGQGGGK